MAPPPRRPRRFGQRRRPVAPSTGSRASGARGTAARHRNRLTTAVRGLDRRNRPYGPHDPPHDKELR